MSRRLLAKSRYCLSSIMVSRCLASCYRSICSYTSCFSPKKYHLLSNGNSHSTPNIFRTNLMREISSTMSLSLFLLYLFYQLFGNILFIFVLIFGVLVTLYALQDALLFQPSEPDTSRLIVQTPDLYQMPYETIVIETIDHEKLHGFLIKQPERADQCETLLFFHGNAGNIGHRIQNAYLLYRHCQMNILLFDYRGYGKSTGVPSETGLYLDAQAVYDYARRRSDLNQEKIFLFGRSLGGAVALHLAAQLSQTDATPPLYCLMLENTFTSIPDMAKRLFPVFLLDYIPFWMYKNLFLSVNKIRHVQVPVLFLSGEQDELVPLQMMQKLHAECQSTKKHLALFPDGQHNTTWLCHHYADRIRQYLNEV